MTPGSAIFLEMVKYVILSRQPSNASSNPIPTISIHHNTNIVIPNLPFAIMPSQQITVYPIGSCVLAHYRHTIIHGMIEENGHDRTTGKKARLYVRLLKDFCEFNLLTTKVVLRGVCSESNELVLTKEYVTIAVEDIITPLFIFKKQLIEEQGLVLQERGRTPCYTRHMRPTNNMYRTH